MVSAEPSFPVRLVCPGCHGSLEFSAARMECRQCARQFPLVQGFPDLILGGRFEDELNEEQNAYEEQSNADLTGHYLAPLFRQLWTHPSQPPRLLSLGCGVGVDVDLLTDAGFDIVGIDCGSRVVTWQQRRQRNRFFLANGKNLPFEDSTFDAVYCGCVFPHVGVEGDSTRLLPHGREERLAIAREMARVLKPGGFIMVSSPNRWFPIDIFHGRTPQQPYPRWNSPLHRFLLSPGDYRALFRQAGCNRFRLLPVTGYWGFIRIKKTWKGRLLVWPVQTVFRLVSAEPLRFLRGSPISPWLVMLIQKSPA